MNIKTPSGEITAVEPYVVAKRAAIEASRFNMQYITPLWTTAGYYLNKDRDKYGWIVSELLTEAQNRMNEFFGSREIG